MASLPMMAHMRSSSSGPYAPSTASPRIHGGVECGRESRADSISTLWSSADVPLFLDSRVSRVGGGGSIVGSRFSEVSTMSGSFPWQTTSRGSGDSQAPQDQLIEELVQTYGERRDSGSTFAGPSPQPQQQQWLPRPSEASTRIPSLSLSNSDGSRQGSVSTPTAASFPAFQQASPPTRLQKQRPTMLQLNGAPLHPPSRDINAPFMPVSVSYSSQLTYTGRSPTMVHTPLTASSKKSNATQPSPLGSPLLNTPVSGDAHQLFHRRAETEPSPDILYGEAQRFFDPSYTMASPPPLPTPPPPAELAEQRQPWSSPTQRKSRRQRQSTATYATEDSNEGTAESSMSSGSATSSCLPDPEQEDAGMAAMLVLPVESNRRPSTAPGDSLAYLDRSQSVQSLTKASSPTSSPLRGIAARIGRYDSGPRPSTSDAISASSSPRKATGRPSNLYELELDTPHSRDSSSITSKRATLGARLRAVSTPKLRQAASGWRAQTADGTAPELPAKSIPTPDSAARTSSRGTSAGAYPPQAPSGRFRSRTVGEADRRSPSTPSSAQPPLPAGSRPSSTELAARKLRRRSKDTLSSSFTSSAHSFLHTPFSSSSHLPGTTAPSTPAPSTKSASRPKSKGGWASHLADGLSLHIEHDGRREVLRMSYLYYDPFGKPENLCASDATAQAAANARPTTPSKRPKSKNGAARESAEEQVGILEFGLTSVPGSPTALTFADRGNAGPVLRHLTIGDDTKADLLTRQATLSLCQNGTHEVSGSERKGRLAWRFTFNIDDYEPGVKILRPVGFSCSATLLDPMRARKGRLLNSIRKQILVPNIVSVAVIGSPAASSVGLPETISSGATSDGRDSMSSSQPTMSRMGSFGDLHYNAQRAPSSASSTWSPASKPAVLRSAAVPSNLPPGVVPFKMTRQGMSLSSRSNASFSSSANSRGASQSSTPASPSSPGQQRSLALPSPVSPHFASAASRHLAAPASRRRGSSLGEASRADPLGSLGLTPGPEAVVSEVVMPPQPISPRQRIKPRLPAHLTEAGRPSTGDAVAYHRPRAYTTASSRPQTASEEIKAAYLSRGGVEEPKILSSRSVSANVVPSVNARAAAPHARPFTADVLNVQPQPAALSSPSSRGWKTQTERPAMLAPNSRSSSSTSTKKQLPSMPASAARQQQPPQRPARDNAAQLFTSLQEQGWM